jgi:uncharacterized protein with HEPN domain
MSDRLHKWLVDITIAIEEIESYYENNRTFEFFKSDRIRKKASERNLEIIGEAMNRILNNSPEIQITNARRIVNFRNIIIHTYDAISDENVWSVIINHLPILKQEVETIITNNYKN